MKITPIIVREFEKEQKQYGTKIAIQNIIWSLASDIFKDLGVNRVRTEYAKKK